ncbi:hypothetical protein VCHC59A1_1253B, partial [Vibrio cholerae HC-59A1]
SSIYQVLRCFYEISINEMIDL